MSKSLGIFMLFMLPLILVAQEGSQAGFQGFDKVVPTKANKDFQAFVYFYQQNVAMNIAPENDFLKGQIVGRLFGGNTTKTSNDFTAMYAEQRIIPFFVYSPKLFDGKATLRTSFEIDWTWGDVSYGTGGNQGSAISADQVNIQTQNVEIELVPHKNWTINLGLQRMFDTPHDLYRTTVDKFTNTAYRLAYFGTDGVGVSVRRQTDYNKTKLGYYKLYENNVELNDDVTLMEFSHQINVAPTWNIGGSVYWVKDNSSGKGGVSILGQGYASPLANYNGTFRFPIGADPYQSDVVWLGTYFSKNEDMMMGRWFMSGFLNYNLGSIRQKSAGADNYTKTVSIGGLGANLRGGYRYGQTTGDAITADLLYTSGDNNGINDKKYSGVMTANTWGSPGGIFIGHGGYLLFPHGNVVNRFVAAVTDISNMGYGIAGGTLNLARDLIPNKLHSKIGGATGFASVAPVGGGNFMGWEVNGKLGYDFGAFLTVEAHAAYMGLGDFYDSTLTNGGVQERPVNPWLGFVCIKWLIF
ncbi:MAG: hypothetical protein LC107_08770 [Chitinophagales bacterium]|nr:hypothetical protein [Chitinophagales bacterium]